jgi:kinesin family protein C1
MDALENHALPQSNAKLQQALGQIDLYKKELEEKKSTISQYECDIDELKRRNEATVREMKENEVEFQSLISQGAEMHSFLEDEVKRKNGIISQLEGTVASLKKMIEKEEVRALDFKAKFESTLKELEAANETQHQLENKLSQAEEQLQKDAEFKEEVIHKNKKSSASVKAMEKDRQNLNERLKQIEIELAKTREERDHAIIRLGTSDKREDELFEKLLESDRVRRELHARVMYLSGNIRVFVRVRPPIPGEEENCTEDDKHFRFGGNGGLTGQINTKYGSDDPTKNLLEVIEPKKDRGGLSERRKKWTFGFDQIYDPSCDQRDVWEGCEPLIQSAIDGFNVTIFAYGQTGSGKTYTMLGDSTRSDSEGIISRAVRKLFDSKAKIEELSRGEKQVFLSVELLEIYNENVRDLLSASKQDTFLKIVANEAVGSTHLPVNSEMDVFKVLEMAQKRRCVKATASNATSSRSHMLFTIVFNVQSKDGTAQTGKLHVCDLAGSERLGKSGANNVGGALLNETKHINLSLSTLSNVIEKLQAGDSNVPFRESKLTSLLQNSLGGNSKTLCIVCANPLQAHFHETLCSLRFAAKINKVDLKAQQNFSA